MLQLFCKTRRLPLVVNALLLLALSISCDEINSTKSFSYKPGTWQALPYVNKDIKKLFFIDSNNGWALGETGGIYSSLNGGKIWNTLSSGTTNRLYSILFTDTQNGFAAGTNNTMLHTTNGGKDWNAINIQSDVSTMFASLSKDNCGNIWFITNYGEVFCSTNNGQDWISKHKFNEWGYSYVFFPNPTYGFAMKTTGKELEQTVDGGITWSSYSIPTDCQWLGDIFFLDDKYGWYSENWLPSSSGHSGTALYRTVDGGVTWTCMAQLDDLSLDNIHFIDLYNGWLSSGAKILQTTDGGKTWRRVFEASANEGYIEDVFFVDASNGWAVTSTSKVIKYSK